VAIAGNNLLPEGNCRLRMLFLPFNKTITNYELRKGRIVSSDFQRRQVLCTLTGWFVLYRKNRSNRHFSG
jgi:hypothetical protein